MFWGLVLKANKRYSQRVTKAFHVSQATLDTNTIGDDKSVVQVWVTIDDVDHLIANVSGRASHVAMDVTFSEGELVAFYSKGTGTVHLSGCLLPEDDFGMGGEEEEEESDEEMVEHKNKELVSSKKQEKSDNKKSIKSKAGEEESDDDDDDDDDDEEEDDDDDESDDIDDETLLQQLEEAEDEEDDTDDEEMEDAEEEDSDISDEEEVQPPSKMAKIEKGANQNGLTNGKLPKKDKEQKHQQQQQQQKQQKNKKQDQKQEQKQKNQQPNQQQQQQQKGANTKQLAGGVIIEDLRAGKGPEAKIGKKISVYYEGRLKSNNKVFDSTKSSDGFQFQLGRGEVIRGWDVGIVGMKVGSKRRITCPPNVAYGSKGSPPVIPANATLVFDVELRGVN